MGNCSAKSHTIPKNMSVIINNNKLIKYRPGIVEKYLENPGTCTLQLLKAQKSNTYYEI